ncbi:MAG: histidine kinase N-terminal 7TM domain-containing protein, partial [bacterium]
MLKFIATYYSISALSVAIISFLIGTFVVRKNIKKALNRAFFFWSFAVCLWAVFYFIWQIEIEAKPALLWTRLLMIGAIWAPVFYLKVVILFLDIKKVKQKIILYADYFLATLFTILLITPLMVDRVEPTLGFLFWPKPGLAYGPFLIMFMGTTIYSFYLAIKTFLNKELSATKRSQIIYFLFSFAITIVGGSTNYFLWYNIPIKPYGNILVLAYFFGTTYAIIRYQLMDIRIIARKSTVFLILSGFVYACFFGATRLLNNMFGSIYNREAMIFGIFIALAFVLAFIWFEKL